MLDQKIVVYDGGIQVKDLEIPRKDVVAFLKSVSEEEQEATFIRAVEVGVYRLERARTSLDTEFVRRQEEPLLGHTEKATETIPHEIENAPDLALSTDSDYSPYEPDSFIGVGDVSRPGLPHRITEQPVWDRIRPIRREIGQCNSAPLIPPFESHEIHPRR
jgi:hypothetical protein